MYRLLPPVDSAIEGGGRREEEEVGGRGGGEHERGVEGQRAVRGGRSRGSGDEGGLRNSGVGGELCLSIWFPLCMCMFVFVGEEGRAGKGGGKAGGGISWFVNLEEQSDGLKIRQTSANSRLTALRRAMWVTEGGSEPIPFSRQRTCRTTELM